MANAPVLERGAALHFKRAIVTWIIAYVAITILGTGLYFVIAAIQHTGSTTHPLQDPSYVLENKLLPICNLLIWTTLALVYFGKRNDSDAHTWYGEALRLGALWVAIALPIDFLAFVVAPGPLSMSAHDFYVGQFPWIYLTYVAVFISPSCAVALHHWHWHSSRTLQHRHA